VPSGTSGAKPAKLSYVVKSRHGRLVWLELTPDTGRKHQLRVQLASRGLPILGDRKYGSTTDLGKAIALHARQLTFQHPVSKESVTLMAEPPRAFRDRFAALMNPDLR
jgi:23S rRNA pseudouridine1911/1915/1917 synthase